MDFSPQIRWLGLVDYQSTWRNMQAFTDARTDTTQDEIWLLEHPPVFTQGMSGKPEHVIDAGDIPIVKIDRGGQVTYHGPGQLVMYPLLDLRRLNLGIRELVVALEDAVIALAMQWNIKALGNREAPGVYVDGKKLASIGLRVRRGCSYHGLSLNVAMDTEPFARINPCGYAGLQVTQLREMAGAIDTQANNTQANKTQVSDIQASDIQVSDVQSIATQLVNHFVSIIRERGTSKSN